MAESVHIGFQVSGETAKNLAKLAARSGRTQEDIAREALERLFASGGLCPSAREHLNASLEQFDEVYRQLAIQNQA